MASLGHYSDAAQPNTEQPDLTAKDLGLTLVDHPEEKQKKNTREAAQALGLKLVEAPEEDSGKDSRLYEITKDRNFARLSTYSMSLSIGFLWIKEYLSKFANPENKVHQKLLNGLEITSDLFKRTRMQGQYSLHRDPGSSKHGIAPDDILGDSIHNMSSYLLGDKVYHYHAFWSLPVWGIKNLLIQGNSQLGKLAKGVLNAADNFMLRMTNIFWNFRRVSMGLVPFVGENTVLTAEAIDKEFSPIKHMLEKCRFTILSTLLQPIEFAMEFIPHKTRHNIKKIIPLLDRERLIEKVREIETLDPTDLEDTIKKALGNMKTTLNALVSIDPNDQTLEEDPSKTIEASTPTWYKKSKLLNHLLCSSIGLAGCILNPLAMLIGGIGDIFGIKKLQNKAEKLSDGATAGMSILYSLNEVSSHLRKFLDGLKIGELKLGNLGVFASGAIGMLSKMRILNLIKPGINKLLDPLFFLFFSANRLIDLNKNFDIELGNTPIDKAQEATKINHPLKDTLLLITKIITKDPEVTWPASAGNDLTQMRQPAAIVRAGE